MAPRSAELTMEDAVRVESSSPFSASTSAAASSSSAAYPSSSAASGISFYCSHLVKYDDVKGPFVFTVEKEGASAAVPTKSAADEMSEKAKEQLTKIAKEMGMPVWALYCIGIGKFFNYLFTLL